MKVSAGLHSYKALGKTTSLTFLVSRCCFHLLSYGSFFKFSIAASSNLSLALTFFYASPFHFTGHLALGVICIIEDNLSLSLSFSFIFISWMLITLDWANELNWTELLYNIVVVFLPYIDMNQPWINMCSPSRSPLPPHSLSHPSGSSQCTSPEHLSHVSNLGWRSVPHLIIYMFQCYSLRSFHPRLLPKSPKVCSMHLCLFSCPAYRVIITIF